MRDGLLQPELWEQFFADAGPERAGCLYYSIDCAETPAIRNLVKFENTLNPQHGNFTYVQAVLMLLQHGLLDSANEKFILVSESCIPLTSFASVYNHAMRDDKSYLYHFQVGTGKEEVLTQATPTEYPDEETARDPKKSHRCQHFFHHNAIAWVNGRRAEVSDKTGLDRERFHKFLAQGICFQRDFARFLVDTAGDLDNFHDVRSVDEYHYLCPLEHRKIPFDRYVLRENLMSVTWDGSRPIEYDELSQELVDPMRSWDFFLLRKVLDTCHIDHAF